MSSDLAVQNLCKSVFLWCLSGTIYSGYKGILPCFLGGLVCILFSVISKA